MARKVDHEQRKKEIAAKALRLFSQVGYDNVSLIMIAAAAGVSRTVLYRYFCSKREVLDASIQQADEMFAHREFVIAVFDFVVGMVRTGADMSAGIAEYTYGTRNAIKLLVSHGKKAGEFPEILLEDRTSDAIYAEFESCAMRIVLNTERNAEAAKVRFSDIIHAISNWK